MSPVVEEVLLKMVNAHLALVSGLSGPKLQSVKPSNLVVDREQQPTLEHVTVVLVRAREQLRNSVCVNLKHVLGFRIGVNGPLVPSPVVLELCQDLELALVNLTLTALVLLITSLLVKRKHAHGLVIAGTAMQTVILTTAGTPTPTVTPTMGGTPTLTVTQTTGGVQIRTVTRIADGAVRL